MQSAANTELKFKIQMDGKMYLFEPQHNITTFELAQLTKFLLVSIHGFVPNEMREQFVKDYNLQRHFVEEQT